MLAPVLRMLLRPIGLAYGLFWYRHGCALAAVERAEEGLHAFDRAIRVGLRGFGIRIARADCLLQLDRKEEAEAEYGEALRLRPRDIKTLKRRAELRAKLGLVEEAEEDFDAIEMLRPQDSDIPFQRGMMLYNIGEHSRAAEVFELAAERKPRDRDILLWRGACYCNLGLYDLALDDLAGVISTGRCDAADYRWRGQAHAYLREFDAALADFDKALQLDPYVAQAHSWRGWILIELGRWEEARYAYDEAIRLDRDTPHYYEQRSKIWDRLGHDDLAAADFEIVEELELKANPPLTDMNAPATDLYPLIRAHFSDTPLEQLSLTERFFPARVSPDVQHTLDALGETKFVIDHFVCPKQNNSPVYNFQALYTRDRRNPITASAPHHYEVDIGEEKPVRCLWNGVWLMTYEGTRLVVLTTADQHHRRFQVAALANPAGEKATSAFFTLLEDAISKSNCYRGKVLSLEMDDDYQGTVTGLKVHRLRPVRRGDVILPAATLDLLDRNVIEFVKARERLRQLGLTTKKGLLFHGPPGTGKTHTIHYLAGALAGTTTLLITADQVGNLAEYMTLARMLQPTLVVLEDVDLIARERRTLRSGVEETLLNRLLNEMDGLKPDADILFILTTNAPDSLEEALANRPGRVDQAIEFPYPDREGRAKLVRMYAGRVVISDDLVERIANRHEEMSPAFIKELMRRAAQPAVLRGTDTLTLDDIDRALDEMLFAGGVNSKLFGFGGRS